MKNLFLILTSTLEDRPSLNDFGNDFVEKVFPNLWAFLVQLIAFIIMVLIVIKFAYKPVHNFIEKRKEYIAKNLEEAATKNAEADKYLADTKASLQNSQKQAIEIIQDAKLEATKQKEAILDETQKEIAAKHAKAQEDIKIEQQKALQELHDEVVDIAMEATKNILDREVNKKDDKKLVDDFVKDLMEK